MIHSHIILRLQIYGRIRKSISCGKYVMNDEPCVTLGVDMFLLTFGFIFYFIFGISFGFDGLWFK